MRTEKELFAEVMQRCMLHGTYQTKIDALQQIEAGLLRCADPVSRIRWLWGATDLHCKVGNIERAITTAQEGLEIAERQADLLFTSIFQLKLGAALASTADWGRGIPYLDSTSDVMPMLDRSARDGMASELVQGWLTIPSILDRLGLPKAVRLLAQALDGAIYTDRFSRAQALTLLANGILECRHLPGEEVPDLHAAVLAAREAMRLAPTRTQTEGSAMLLLANALCLGETDDPVAALEHAQILVQDSWALMDELGYPDAAAGALTSGVTIARRLVAIRRDPAPDLPRWIIDCLERMRSGPLTVGRGQASFAVAQYYLDDAVRGSLRAIAAAQQSLEDAIACRPPAQFKLEGMVALAHQAALSDGIVAEQLLAAANRLAQQSGRKIVEYHFLLQRALNGDPEGVRRAIDRATAVLQVLPPSDRETAGQLLEVIGKGQRRLGAPEPALEAFRSCLETYQARLAEAGSPVERAERIASSEKISEEIYHILLELNRPMEAVRLVERNKLRADSLGAAIRQGAVGDEKGRQTANKLAATQARLEALPISSLAERTIEARSMRELWHQLDSIVAENNENETDLKPSPGTMFVLRATEQGGFAHLLPNHILHNDPELVVPLPDFTRNRLTKWVAHESPHFCVTPKSLNF